MEIGAGYACDVGHVEDVGCVDHLLVQGNLDLQPETALTFRISGATPFNAGNYR